MAFAYGGCPGAYCTYNRPTGFLNPGPYPPVYETDTIAHRPDMASVERTIATNITARELADCFAIPLRKEQADEMWRQRQEIKAQEADIKVKWARFREDMSQLNKGEKPKHRKDPVEFKAPKFVVPKPDNWDEMSDKERQKEREKKYKYRIVVKNKKDEDGVSQEDENKVIYEAREGIEADEDFHLEFPEPEEGEAKMEDYGGEDVEIQLYEDGQSPPSDGKSKGALGVSTLPAGRVSQGGAVAPLLDENKEEVGTTDAKTQKTRIQQLAGVGPIVKAGFKNVTVSGLADAWETTRVEDCVLRISHNGKTIRKDVPGAATSGTGPVGFQANCEFEWDMAKPINFTVAMEGQTPIKFCVLKDDAKDVEVTKESSVKDAEVEGDTEKQRQEEKRKREQEEKEKPRDVKVEQGDEKARQDSKNKKSSKNDKDKAKMTVGEMTLKEVSRQPGVNNRARGSHAYKRRD